MNEIGTFNFDGNNVRTVYLADSESPWYVAADVCRALDLHNVPETVKRLKDYEKTKVDIGWPANVVNVVNESGLYSLIFESTKPEAEQFKKWITTEVIPSIRKRGYYGELPPGMERGRDTILLSGEPKTRREQLLTNLPPNPREMTIAHWQRVFKFQNQNQFTTKAKQYTTGFDVYEIDSENRMSFDSLWLKLAYEDFYLTKVSIEDIQNGFGRIIKEVAPDVAPNIIRLRNKSLRRVNNDKLVQWIGRTDIEVHVYLAFENAFLTTFALTENDIYYIKHPEMEIDDVLRIN